MSVEDDLKAVKSELESAKQELSVAGGVLAASMSVAEVMRNEAANVWRIVAAKRMVKITNHYVAGILSIADQLTEELKQIVEKGAR